MTTKISKLYLELLIDLAKQFSETRSLQYSNRYRKKVYNSTYNTYYTIGIFLYIKLFKLSSNSIKFSYNHIDSAQLKKFSCKLYKQIIDDLIKHKIIIRNDHYLHHKTKGFSKSYLIHKSILSKINKAKSLLNYQCVDIEISDKLNRIGKFTTTKGIDDSSIAERLNRYNSKNNIQVIEKVDYFYNNLSYDEQSLDNYCKNDDFAYLYFYRKLKKLNDDPKFIKGRYYHVFHELPKKFRESVLRFEGEQLKEIFDVKACDLHMLCKLIEKENIPVKELNNFENSVKNDFRLLFGKKKNGKCTSNVKKAFKVYLNSKKSFYSDIRYDSICFKIDQYFQQNFPNVRQYIIRHDNFWQDMMNLEFGTISEDMFTSLKKKGIKSFTCHDAIYVKKSVEVDNINDIFYDSLGLAVDYNDKFDKMFQN